MAKHKKNKPSVQPNNPAPNNPQVSPTEVFTREYTQLCEKHGLQIIVNPAFKARDDGTWSIVVQASVGQLSTRGK